MLQTPSAMSGRRGSRLVFISPSSPTDVTVLRCSRGATFDGLFLTSLALPPFLLLPYSCNPSGPQNAGVPHSAQVVDFVSAHFIELVLVGCLATHMSRIKSFRSTAVVVLEYRSNCGIRSNVYPARWRLPALQDAASTRLRQSGWLRITGCQ